MALYAVRDILDGTWQFLDSTDFRRNLLSIIHICIESASIQINLNANRERERDFEIGLDFSIEHSIRSTWFQWEKEEEEKNKVASNCGMELAFSLIFLHHFVQVVHQFQKSFKLTDGKFMMAFDWVDVFLSWWGKYNNEISFEKNTKTLVPRAEIFPIWMLLGNRFHLQ